MMKQFLIVGAGGMIGSMLRFGCNLLIRTPGLPVATLLVNIMGSFAIGMIAAYGMKWGEAGAHLRLFLATGICGGFTTFSALSLESLTMLQEHKTGLALLYIGLSAIFGIAACYLGYHLINK